MIIRYPDCLLKNPKVKEQFRCKERRNGYRELLEELDEEYVLNHVPNNNVDSNYYRKILNDIDKEYIEKMI
ncbi:hypothetical protein [Oceanirhabdus sp. W0125-5]|uniref:hypothetical protein n=1 Tax=Oceanirhabdus sp. W0125-5 TaxID=2999116 RepID=UPI0022F2D208|nr:hypothetical protein [Oceanirhabdus sp. W0125-5]WBW95904.1 hypothetical protein OW730_19760 [Oceanirhabdus sp. W0125-5]